MTMKKIPVIFLLFVLVLPLGASYSPSFTLLSGPLVLARDGKSYLSLRSGVELSLISLKLHPFTFSIPLGVSYVTKSTVTDYTFSPSFFKNEAGVEIVLEGKRLACGIAAFLGYEDYEEERAVMKFIEGRLSAHLLLDGSLSLLAPFSFTFTPEGNEYSLSLALRIGGEV